MEKITHENFNPAIPENVHCLLGRLAIAYGRLDSTLTNWIANETKGDLASTFILVGRMEITNKLRRLISLFELTGDSSKRAAIKKLQRDFKPHQNRRNVIAHQFCLGMAKDNPRQLGFLGLHTAKRGSKGDYLAPITRISVDDIRQSEKAVTKMTQEIAAKYIPLGDDLPPSPLSGLPQ